MFHQKITDIYSTASDYDVESPVTKKFFATVQNKMHSIKMVNSSFRCIYSAVK